MENKTENLLSEIRKQALTYDVTQKDKLDKNVSLKVAKSDFKASWLNSGVIARMTIDNMKNTIAINMTNGYIMAIMTKVYNADFNSIKSALKTTSEYCVFNGIISKELRENQKPFLNGLN